jgi:hypothetical protein
VFLGVPSRGLGEVIGAAGLPRRTPVISLAKGLVPPDGAQPSALLAELLGPERVAVIGGPAHLRRGLTLRRAARARHDPAAGALRGAELVGALARATAALGLAAADEGITAG